MIAHVRTQMIASRSATALALVAWPSIAWANDAVVAVVTISVTAGFVGAVAGGISAWRSWNPILSFVGAVGIFAVAATLPGSLGDDLDLADILSSLLLASLIGHIPVGAGYTLGRWVVPLRARRQYKGAGEIT